MAMEVSLNFTSMTYAIHMAYSISQPVSRTHKQKANANLEHIHAFFTNLLCTVEIYMADTVKPSDIDVFLSDAA
jgi:hypothetical protein